MQDKITQQFLEYIISKKDLVILFSGEKLGDDERILTRRFRDRN